MCWWSDLKSKLMAGARIAPLLCTSWTMHKQWPTSRKKKIHLHKLQLSTYEFNDFSPHSSFLLWNLIIPCDPRWHRGTARIPSDLGRNMQNSVGRQREQVGISVWTSGDQMCLCYQISSMPPNTLSAVSVSYSLTYTRFPHSFCCLSLWLQLLFYPLLTPRSANNTSQPLFSLLNISYTLPPATSALPASYHSLKSKKGSRASRKLQAVWLILTWNLETAPTCWPSLSSRYCPTSDSLLCLLQFV